MMASQALISKTARQEKYTENRPGILWKTFPDPGRKRGFREF